MSRQSFAHDVLVRGDVAEVRRRWNDLFPHLAGKGPKTDQDAEVVLHLARTQSASVPETMRLWSHRWLEERSLPSGLPEELKPKAERVEPLIAAAVGIAVKGKGDPELNMASIEIRTSMERAVLEADADGRLADSGFVRARMEEARHTTQRQLFGRQRVKRTLFERIFG